MNFTLLGFSGKRVGYVLAFVSFALIPMHFCLSCAGSGAVAGIGMIILLTTSVLFFLVPRGTPRRLLPVVFSSIAMLGHMLCAH